MRSVALSIVVCVSSVLCACTEANTGDGHKVDVGQAAETDAGRDLPSGDVDSGGPRQSDAGMKQTTTMDRCLTPPCDASGLPVQPNLLFLEDMGDDWQRLMEADWELAPGAEGYRCMTLTIPRDIYIVAFGPQSPRGTHHATFGVSSKPTGPDTVVACSVGATGERRLQGSGAGSEPSQLPTGVAMPLHKGEQVMMNLHLFNINDSALRGRSGMWIKTVSADAVQHEAETVLAGPLQLTIPVGRSTQSGSCTLRADATIYSVGPHMHQKGVHLRATAQTSTGQVAIYDGDYDFSHQLVHSVDSIQLKRGDRVNVECTYVNDSQRTINWGDSSLDEMCFIGLSLYPAIGYGGLPCAN